MLVSGVQLDDMKFYRLFFMYRASLVAHLVKYLPAMQETHVQSLGRDNPLEKGMDTLSNILAWRIPWTEEPERLQSMASQRVRLIIKYWLYSLWKVKVLVAQLCLTLRPTDCSFPGSVSIAGAIQYILEHIYFIHSSLYLLFPTPVLPIPSLLFPLITTPSFSVSASLFLLCYIL